MSVISHRLGIDDSVGDVGEDLCERAHGVPYCPCRGNGPQLANASSW
jgi:hypothetical protein